MSKECLEVGKIIFVSQLENMMPAEELNFDATPAFGKYKKFLTNAISHPAKMNTSLLEFLIENFVEPDEVILDPMAGSGSTGVVAALHGRNAICVELERKFYEWMEKARGNVEKYQILSSKGNIRNICGDARKLSELLGVGADSIITSPPYVDGSKGPSRSPLWERLSQDPTSNRYGRKKHPTTGEGYGKDKGNIGNLHFKEVDSIITSPPYAEANHGGGIAQKGYEGKYGKDSNLHLRHDRPLSDNPGNISNLHFKEVDSIITSPPYEDTQHFHDMDFMKKITEDQNRKLRNGLVKGHGKSEKAATKSFNTMANGKLENPANIGKTQKETYLEAMLQVYSEMYKVLKVDGIAIIVIKPFQRKGCVVDLPLHTYLLMEKVGFKLEKLYKLKLKQMSFWRILQYRKNPLIPQIKHEYIIIARK